MINPSNWYYVAWLFIFASWYATSTKVVKGDYKLIIFVLTFSIYIYTKNYYFILATLLGLDYMLVLIIKATNNYSVIPKNLATVNNVDKILVILLSKWITGSRIVTGSFLSWISIVTLLILLTIILYVG